MNKYISEFIGTAILFGAVIGSGIMGSILSPDDSWLILLYNSLVTSFANPAGTIGRTFSDTFAGISPESILFFCIAQVIGSLMAFILYKNFYKKQ